MRRLITLVLLGLAAPAFAQEPAWVTEQVESTRFADAEHPGPPLDEGDRVEVVLRDGDRVRVRKGTRFGWVPAAVLTDQAPATEEPPPSLLMDSDFDMQAIQESLQRSLGEQAPGPSAQ